MYLKSDTTQNAALNRYRPEHWINAELIRYRLEHRIRNLMRTIMFLLLGEYSIIYNTRSYYINAVYITYIAGFVITLATARVPRLIAPEHVILLVRARAIYITLHHQL